MKSVLTLQQDRAHKQRVAQDLVDRAEKDGRPLNVEELGLFDKAKEEIFALDAEIAAMEEHIKRANEIVEIRNRLEQGNGRQTAAAAPAHATETQVKTLPAEYKRHSCLKAFTGPNGAEKAYRAGQWAAAVIFGNNKSALWCESHFPGFKNALGTNNDSAGGVLVPEELTSTIIDLREQYGVFRQQAMIYPMSSDTAIIPRRSGGVTASFVGQNPSSGPTASTPSFNSVRLTAQKLAVLTVMSTEIAEDALISMADWLAQEMAYSFALKEDQCGFTGDGTSTYGGINGLGNILIAGQSLKSAVDATSGHDTFAEIDATDLTNVMSVLPAYARANAKWYCSTVAFDLVFGRLMANAGGNTIVDMQGGYQPRYLGYPIVISQVLPTSTSTINDVPMLYFGDLRLSSTMGTRRDIRVVPSNQRYLELDQLAFFATERFDIVNHDYGDTSVAGPIVALVGNT